MEATTVTLMPGSFTFTAIRLQGVGATLTTSGPGSVTVVTNSVATDTHSTIKPASGYTASDLTIFTAGSTVLEGSTRALVVAHDIVEVAGSFTGAIAASRIALHNATTVNFEDGINIAASTGSQQLSGYYANQDTYCVTNELSPHQTMTLAFALPLPDPTGLESFIADRSDPTSPNYRQWFADVAAFKAANYAPSDSDYAALEAWATANGLTIVETFPTNMLLTVSGTVAAFEAALHARLYFRDNGTTQGFIAPDREPSLDLGPSLRWIAGLDNWSPPGPADCGKSPLAQDFTSSAGIVGALSASDFRQAYLGTDSACRAFDGTALDGTGQTVAIYDKNVVIDIPTERTGYINMQPIGTTGVFTGSVIHSPLNNDNGTPTVSNGEASMDMEMVMAMAPGANIQLFHDQTGAADAISFQHVAQTGGISVLSSSWFPSKNGAVQDAQMLLASLGISYFVASGDSGDLGDTLNWVDMDFQTLVGGTHLATHGGTVTGSGVDYDDPYYNFEGTWNDGCGSQPGGPDTNENSGGGVLNGGCTCFPQPACCSTGTVQPAFQAGVPMDPINFSTLSTNAGGFEVVDPNTGNGGSTTWRVEPDVAACAENVGVYVDGEGISGGTSAATPLWAGFTAVANQLSALKSIPQIGYANPVLYGVGKSSASNTVFHDAADGVFNQEPIPNLFSLGHPAVVGYDLATGWESFSCPLMQALGGPARTELWVRVENGNDGLNDQTSVDLTVSTTMTPFTVNLKAENETGWSDGGLIHDKVIPLDAIVRPEDITGVTVTMNENGQGGLTADNWDIGGIQISLISASTDTSTPMACLVDLSGNGNCNETQAGSNVQPSCQPAGTLGNTSDTGVARLSENDDDSGQGPTASFSVSASNTGCPPWSNTVSAQPFGAYEIIVDTTDDGMNAGSLATFTILDHDHTGGVAATGGLTGPTPDRFEFATGASVFSGDDNLSQLGDSSNNVLEIDFSPSSGDNWVVNGFTVVGRPAGGTGPDTCIMRWTGSALFTGTDPQFFPLSGCQ